MARRRATIACDLPLKRAVDGSDRSKPEGGPARVDAKRNEAEMTCIHDQPGLLAYHRALPLPAAAGEVRGLHVIFAGSAPGAPVGVCGESELKGHLERLACAAEALADEPSDLI